MAEIRTTLYSKELQKQIFPDNDFYKKSVAETGVADTTETVESRCKPQSVKRRKANRNPCP